MAKSEWHNTADSAEWKKHWPLVFAAMAGYSFNMIPTNTTGLFLDPVTTEFGWTRAQFSLGITINGLATIFLSPIVGTLLDRWGSRKIAIGGITLSALSLAAFGLADGSIAQWLILWTIFAIVSAGVTATVWTAAISGIFSSSRGLALGVTISGGALAQILVPPLSYFLIQEFGWRAAYVGLGLGWGIVVLIIVILFLYGAHDYKKVEHRQNTSASEVRLPGISIKQALRSVLLWRIAAASLITIAFGIGVISFQVPILTEAGVPRGRAALLASAAGVAGIAGKLITGYLMDRRPSDLVASMTLAMGGAGFLLLLQPFRSSIIFVLAMLIIGYSTGAKLQISAYLVSRYAGLRNFGVIFGFVVSLISVAASLGVLLTGYLRDTTGSYALVLLMGIVGSVLSALLVAWLGPYPDWSEEVSKEPDPME